MAIALVGFVYVALLHGSAVLVGGRLVANALLHGATPLLAVVFWLAFVPKGRLQARDPLLWTLLPLGYLGYYLLRGGLTGRYVYPFMDPGRAGWPSALFGMAGTAALFLALGYLLLWLDRLLGRDPATR